MPNQPDIRINTLTHTIEADSKNVLQKLDTGLFIKSVRVVAPVE